MRSLILGLGAAAMLFAAPAMATPQGPYAGFSVGYGMGDADTDVTISDQDYFATSSITDIEQYNPSSLDTDGLMLGGFFGYMWAFNGGAFGFEGDINWYNADDSAAVTREYPCCAPTTYTVGHELERNWLATLRARWGFDVSPMLFLYLTGGLAIGDADYSVGFEDDFEPIAFTRGTNSDTMTGWTLGLGGEFMHTNGVSIRAEYLYVDLGDIDAHTDLSSEGYDDVIRGTADVTDHIFRISAVFGF